MERKDYKTRQRDAVRAIFASHPQRSMTATEAFRTLQSKGYAISRTTVYRTVTMLYQQGKLLVMKEGAAPTRYQHRNGKQNYISVRCFRCGMIADLTCDAVNNFEQHLREKHGFFLQEDQCLLPGLCKNCRNT